MRIDTMTGPLAFRCGCGASFNLKAPHLDFAVNRCIWQRKKFRCSARVSGDVPICPTHAVEFMRRFGDEGIARAVDSLADRRTSERRRAEEERWKKYRAGQEILKQKRYEEAARGSVVYYVRIRPGQVKIGTTIHLEDRMKSMRAHQREDVLAAEPGTRELEKVRHAQFKATRIDCRREDFLDSPELMSHIAMVREHFGDPFDLVARLVAEGAA